MEPEAAWLPWDSQALVHWSMEPGNLEMANWTMEPTVWAPGPSMESESTEVFVSCLQTSSAPPTSTGDKLMVDQSSAQQELELDFDNIVIKIHSDPIHVFEKAARDFKDGVDTMRMKIHRYPATIRSLGELYTVPTTVAIGPYHHGRDHLKPAEKVKHVAAYHCIRESGRSVQEIYEAVISVADDARRLYDSNIVDGIGDDDFLPMMFYDACFLVQYMLTCTTITGGLSQMDPALRSFFDANDDSIYRDIMQLENQLPWRVVEAVMRFRPVSLTEFVASVRGCLQDRKVPDEKPFVLVDGNSYDPPPHLLGLLRYYIVGRSDAKLPSLPETEAISFSVSAMELAEIGITLTANETTTELIHMGVKKKKGHLFAELSLAPLSLDDTRASLLVNMAALELCMTPSFHDAEDEASAVCSYLLLLGMMVEREEDVHELRRRRLLQGGGGHTNKAALEFLTSLQGLRLGSRYVRTMEEIESYKVRRWMSTKVHAFVYKNMKTILTVVSSTAAVVGILGTLKSLKVIH
ncbi:hypothetical protein HU200_066224 [Digitaria exilis]|uniref:Uncharacterized protein n=1 Tax=Digitaria exilis TaxID=1010633 RepID=A0A835A2I0_9POAL|nr:hypothetical protein HU200_066224 [Digitaria exilis]